ncbi:MAG: hypothetical protein QOG10_2286 [Kribbellaceae bacterium]|jgi:hypothetical protein|nr:hypothetical protein [Kribbellaceae bacterium]
MILRLIHVSVAESPLPSLEARILGLLSALPRLTDARGNQRRYLPRNCVYTEKAPAR